VPRTQIDGTPLQQNRMPGHGAAQAPASAGCPVPWISPSMPGIPNLPADSLRKVHPTGAKKRQKTSRKRPKSPSTRPLSHVCVTPTRSFGQFADRRISPVRRKTGKPQVTVCPKPVTWSFTVIDKTGNPQIHGWLKPVSYRLPLLKSPKLQRISLQLNAMSGHGAAQSDRIGRGKPCQPAQDGELGPQQVAFAAGCQHPARRLLGQGDGLVG
jgi:hypothetical protein